MQLLSKTPSSEDISRLAASELQLWNASVNKRGEIATAETREAEQLADRLQNGAALTFDASPAAGLRSELATLHASLGVIRDRRIKALHALRAGRAQAIREDAAKVQQRFEALEGKVKKALATLSTLEECSFDRSCLRYQRTGLDDFSSVPVDHSVAGMMSTALHFQFASPLSYQLQAEIERLTKEAERVESAELEAAGVAEGNSLAELIGSVLADPFRITPPLESISQWAAAAVAKVDPDHSGHVHVVLSWTGGNIDERGSRAELIVQPAQYPAQEIFPAKQWARLPEAQIVHVNGAVGVPTLVS